MDFTFHGLMFYLMNFDGAWMWHGLGLETHRLAALRCIFITQMGRRWEKISMNTKYNRRET
jgi:hypothetical protein